MKFRKPKKINLLVVRSALSLLLVSSVGCGIYETKTRPASVLSSNAAMEVTTQVSFAQVKTGVFEQSCQHCHMDGNSKGGVTLDNYALTRSHLDLIKSTVLGGGPMPMPPRGGIPEDQKALLQQWLNQGAPEDATILTTSPTPSPGTPTPTASPTPDPLVTPTPTATPAPTPAPVVLMPTFQSIRDNVFNGPAQCISCHAAGGSAQDYPLDTYATMMAVSGFIVPGDPNASALMGAIGDGGYMPPAPLPAIPADQVMIIKLWITNGAPQ